VYHFIMWYTHSDNRKKGGETDETQRFDFQYVKRNTEQLTKEENCHLAMV